MRRTRGRGLIQALVDTPISIEVTEAMDDGYVLEWVFGRSSFPDSLGVPPGVPVDLFEEILELTPMTAIVRTDAAGTNATLVNADGVDDRVAAIEARIAGAVASLDGEAAEDFARLFSVLTIDIFAVSPISYHLGYGQRTQRGTTTSSSLIFRRSDGALGRAERTLNAWEKGVGGCPRLSVTTDFEPDNAGTWLHSATVYEFDPRSSWMVRVVTEQTFSNSDGEFDSYTETVTLAD